MRSLGIFFHGAFIPKASEIRLPRSSCPLIVPVSHACLPTHTYQTEIIYQVAMLQIASKQLGLGKALGMSSDQELSSLACCFWIYICVG